MRLVVAGLMAAPGIAAAGGLLPYGIISGYGTYLQDADGQATDNLGNGVDYTIESDFGWGVTGAAGLGLDTGQQVCNTLGGEIEGGYRSNGLDQITVHNVSGAGVASFGGVGTAEMDGDVSALTVMANARCETPMFNGKFYVLGGGGGANISIDDLSIGGTSVGVSDDDDWVGAYQIGAGWAFPVNPNADLTVGYRYFGTGDPEFTEATGASFDTEYATHNFEVGIKFF
jgi:opacity protein-like surface antigen